MTELLYYSTPIITECGAAVLSCEKDERSGAYKIILDRTMIYPEGGGQPADRGSIVFRPTTPQRSRPFAFPMPAPKTAALFIFVMLKFLREQSFV